MAIKSTKHQFIQKAIAIHGDKYDYSEINYVNDKMNILIFCNKHGGFKQSPCNHLRSNGCPKCSYEKLSTLKRKTSEEFIQKAKAIHGDRYDYSKVNYKNSYSKVIITCPDHGDSEQFPFDHLNGQGCPKCSYEKLSLKFRNTVNEFIEKAKLIHENKYDYSKVIYTTSHTKVIIICSKHGDFEQLPHVHLKGHGCPICKASKGELALKVIFKKHNLSVKPQYRIPDEKYLYKYDFYLPDYNLLIEFHGIQHYEWIPYFHKTQSDFEDQRLRDKCKLWLAKEKSLHLIEFNYKQFKYMSETQFEQFVITSVLNAYKHLQKSK